MDKISLLHLGDIHYDDEIIHNNPPIHLDSREYNWSEMSDEDREDLAPYLIRVVKKQLFRHIEEQKFNSIILSGDLCSRGKINDYEACLKYLEIQFQNFYKKVQKEDLEIAVGNHDLNADFPYDEKNIEERFIKFCELLESKGLRRYPIINVNEKLVETDVGKVLLLNVNSCLEFGNLERLPKMYRDAIQRALDDEGDEADKNRLLNIPFIKDDLIESICEKIEKNSGCLPIIITHHNFLRCRVSNPKNEYDGILNDGIIMQKLLDLNRSILIIHGHIHDDPIRVINSNQGKIVYVSAPLLFPLVNRNEGVKFGYNVINIIFSHTLDQTPLGCEIEKYQLNNIDIIRIPKESIQFFSNSSDAIRCLSDLEKGILKKILCISGDMYLGELFTRLKKDKIIDQDYKLSKLIQIVNRLYWLKLIQFRENEPNVEYSIMRGWFDGSGRK